MIKVKDNGVASLTADEPTDPQTEVIYINLTEEGDNKPRNFSYY